MCWAELIHNSYVLSRFVQCFIKYFVKKHTKPSMKVKTLVSTFTFQHQVVKM